MSEIRTTSTASISSRVSIRWGDGPHQEPTRTLVLTSRNNMFVDLRVKKDPSTSPIDWAFAGLAHKHLGGGSWDHWVDSRTDNPESDSGTFKTLPDGTTLERGMMKDDDGELSSYEEIWNDLPAEPRIDVVLVCLGEDPRPQFQPRPDGDADGDTIVNDLSPGSVCGMVVRVGRFCQGIVKVRGEVTVERWEFVPHAATNDDETDPRGGQWVQQFRFGEAWLPCSTIDSIVAPFLVANGNRREIIIDNTPDHRLWMCMEFNDDESGTSFSHQGGSQRTQVGE